MVFLELQREGGVCSRVTAGEDIKNFCLFSDVQTPIQLLWTPQESKLGLAGQYGCFWSEAGDQGSLSSWNNNIGIPIHFQKKSGTSPFEGLNSVCLSRYQSDVIPPMQMRLRTMAFSRVSTGDSDIPSSCEMKQEPEFKPMQGNPAFF